MISAQVIKNTIEELRSITKIDFCVLDQEGSQVASTWEMTEFSQETVRQFARSMADSQEMQGCHFFKVYDEKVPELVLIVRGTGAVSYTHLPFPLQYTARKKKQNIFRRNTMTLFRQMN